MAQAAYAFDDDLAFAPVRDAVLGPSVSLFGPRDAITQMGEDCRRRGMEVRWAGALSSVLADGVGALGEVICVEAVALSGSELAALVRLDQRASRSGAELLIITDACSLDDVFGCVEGAQAQFLVDPCPSERTLALGTALARLPSARVRELDDDDRLAMLRLTEEIGRLAARFESIAKLPDDAPSPRVGSPALGYNAPGDREPVRKLRAPSPDPRLIQQIIRQRRLRDRYFTGDLFADPAWDILLDLTAARAEHRRVSVTSLCIAAAVPPTTALRWVTHMTEAGLLVREQDAQDRRRIFITLSERVADAMARYFADLGNGTVPFI